MKYQSLKDAIEAFEPGGANAPILYSTTEVNEKSFKALAGRKISLWPKNTAILIVIYAVLFVTFTAGLTILTSALGGTATPYFAFVFPVFLIFLYRETLITITDDGLNFYFLERRFFTKYVVSDKLSLPFDRIDSAKVKTGRFNTRVTFTFTDEGKSYKITTSMPNKNKNLQEQAEHLKRLLDAIGKAS
jgi:ribosomal protein L21E